MPSLVSGQFIAMEALAQLDYAIEGLKPLVMKSGASTKALSVDFDIPHFYDAPVEVVAAALRPAAQKLAQAIKREHIKRFYRGELPYSAEIAYQAVGRGIAITFLRFWDIQKYKMVNRLQVLGAVRH